MGNTELSFATKVTRTLEASDSVRTTVPKMVALLLGVKPGTVLVWKVVPGADSATVSPEAAPKKRNRSD